ncbi:MAG: dUTP diphosphatase [Armatimonadetes bacterium]|jgi:dUTP pyrophosphatase|nr:dUTP diphosphatase [Armatimonadota bacterium]HOC30643.1 dUTP diphosphatase [Armatimonadota bacterium]
MSRDLPLRISITREPDSAGLPLPVYATGDSAGMDLFAACEENVVLHPGDRTLVTTGLRIAIPSGYEGQIRPRSGLALKHGIACLNSPGTIDADYRGIVRVILANLGHEPYVIHRGDRIAQLVIAPVTRVEWQEMDELPATERGDGGFGHTG